MTQLRICLDFDGTLHDPTNRKAGYKMGQPVEGAVEACWQLAGDGHLLMVHTARAQIDEYVQHVVDWLTYFKFPVMPVVVFKPIADVYVDDKALRFTYWDYALEELARRA